MYHNEYGFRNLEAGFQRFSRRIWMINGRIKQIWVDQARGITQPTQMTILYSPPNFGKYFPASKRRIFANQLKKRH